MAILPLGPAGPAVPPAPVGVAAVKADAGMTVGGMRDMIQVAREFITLFKEAEPFLKMLRPVEPEVMQVQREPRMLSEPAPRPPAPEAAAAREATPPQSEVEAARKEEVEKARAELRELVSTKLSKPQILQLAAAFGPFALAEKMPKLADALSAHATEADAFLNAFSEAELRDILCEVLPLVPAKDVPMARMGLLQAVQAFEKEAEKAMPAEEKKDEAAEGGA